MAERIVLAQFDIDSRLLEEKIAQNQTKIDLLNGEIRDTRKAIKEYQDQAKLMAGIISEGNKAIETANEELAQGIITQEQYNYIVGLTTDVIRESEVELSRLIAVEREQQLQLVSYRTDLRNVNEENRELNTLLRSGQTEIQGSEGAYRELSRQQAAVALESRNLGAQLRELEEAGQQNTEEYAQLSAQYEQTTQRAHSMRMEMRELTSATGDNSLNVGNYAEGFKNAFSELSDGAGMLMSGNVQGGFETFKNGLSGIKSGFADLFKFIKANPWLLIVGAIFTYVKEMYEYNQQVRELNNEVEALANTSGDLTDQLRKNATAISDAYGKDFKEAVQEQKSLMDYFKVSAEEAFNVYNEGLARGGALNAEFGDSIREYGPLFAKNGYSAQEFINILNSGIDLRVYSDKLPDAIKEAGLALTEQGKSTRDALVNAFGAPFSDDLLKRIQSGKTSVADGLDEIAAKSAKMHLNEQQLAQLTADVFKGAGEDAGGVLTIFNALNHAQEINAQGLTDIQKQVIKLAELDRDLAEAKDEAFKSDSMMAFQANMEVSWKEIQILWYKSLGNITSFITDAAKGWRLAGMNTIDFLRLIPNTFSKVVSAVANDLSNLASLAKLSGAIIKDALTLNLDGVEAKFNQLKTGISNAFSNTKREIKIFSSFIGSEGIINVKNRNIIADAEAAKIAAKRNENANAENNAKNSLGGIRSQINDLKAQQSLAKTKQEYNELQKQIDALEGRANKITGYVADAATSVQSKALKDLEKQRSDQQKKIEEDLKKNLSNQKEMAEQSVQIAQNELSNYIATNAEKLKSDKRLNQERVNELNKYYNEVEKKQLRVNNEEEVTKSLAIQQKIDEINKKKELGKVLSQNEIDELTNLNTALENIHKEAYTKEIQIQNQTKEDKLKVDKTYLEQKKEIEDLASALAFQKKILDLQEQGASEFDIQKAQEEQRFQEELKTWADQNQIKMDLDNDKYISDQEIQAERDALQLEYQNTKDLNERARIQTQLDTIDNMVRVSAKNQEDIEKAKEKAKLQAISNTLGQAASLFAENTAAYKTLAIAQATINTYLAATAALTTQPPWLGIAMAAVTVAAGLANVAKIAGIGVDKGSVKGYINGGLVNGGYEIKRSNGDNRLVTVKDGEVILNERHQAMLGGPEIFKSIGVPGFANSGIVGGVSKLATIQNAIKQDTVITLDQAAVMEIAQAVYAGSQSGIGDLSNNRQIQNGANF